MATELNIKKIKDSNRLKARFKCYDRSGSDILLIAVMMALLHDFGAIPPASFDKQPIELGAY
jgi:hypothetical protein